MIPKLSRGLLALIVALGFYVFVRGVKEREAREGKSESVDFQADIAQNPTGTLARPFPSPQVSQLPLRPNGQSAWQSFQEKFGSGLQGDFMADGTLVTVRGMPGKTEFAKNSFDLRNPQSVIARAKEIVTAASGLLDVRQSSPLGEPTVQGDQYSAHLMFPQTSEGLPLAPKGAISIDLGSKGELLGLYSDYIRDLQVTNQHRIGQDEAASLAQGSAASQTSSSRPEGGREILWVSGSAGKRAYEFFIDGKQIIVDAETGAILAQKDKRRF